MSESFSRTYKYNPPMRFMTLSETPNQFLPSDVEIVNSKPLSSFPDALDFQFATTVNRNAHLEENTIEPFPFPGLTSRDYLRKDYRFSQLRYQPQGASSGGPALVIEPRNKRAIGDIWPATTLPAVPLGRTV
jgi:hypothetical protein